MTQVCALYETKLHDVEEQKNVFHFYHHSEKLVIAFINITHVIPLWYQKNLRVCEDFHKVHFKNSWENNHSEGC